MKRKQYYRILIILFISTLSAQLPTMEIIGNPERVENEIVTRRDTNGRYCAAIQIVTDLKGVKYESYNGIVGDILQRPGQDMIFLSPDERVLQIFHSDHQELKIIFSELGIKLDSKAVWQIVISGNKQPDQIPINIIVKPAGARITFDNEYLGTGEQFTLSQGEHVLNIEKSEYQLVTDTINVDLTNTLFKYNLKEIEDIALQIFTDPEGADVYIDDLSIGKSPTSAFYPAGRYPIRIEKEWYVTFEGYIDINPPVTTEEYKLQPDFGSLVVSSSPESGLDIYLNNKNQIEITTHTFERLSPGSYAVEGKSQHYETDTEQVTISRGKATKINLKTLENFATLTINTHNKATVKLNGAVITQLKNIRLKPMIANIEVSMPKAPTLTNRITLKKGEKRIIDLYPIVKTGTIQITVKPLDAKIELTGDAGEFYTSEGLYNFKDIPIGTYELKVTQTGFETHAETLKLTEGDKLEREIILNELLTSSVSITVQQPNARIELKGDIGVEFVSLGELAINDIAPGFYRLEISLSGYESQYEPLYLKAGQKVNKNYFLNKKPVYNQKKNFSDSNKEPVSEKNSNDREREVVYAQGQNLAKTTDIYYGLLNSPMLYWVDNYAACQIPLIIKYSSLNKDIRTTKRESGYFGGSAIGNITFSRYYYSIDILSMNFGFFWRSHNHQNRFFLECDIGLKVTWPTKASYKENEKFGYSSDEIIWGSPSDYDDSNTFSKYTLGASDFSFRYERHLGGNKFLVLKSGTWRYLEGNNWYSKSEINTWKENGGEEPKKLDLLSPGFMTYTGLYFGIGLVWW